MMNFLSKFLSGKPQDEEQIEAVAEETASAQPAAEQIAEAAAAPIPDDAWEEPAQSAPPMPEGPMPERPMYDASPSAGMGFGELGPLEEFQATAGEDLLPGSEVADEDALIDAMRTVYDPEIPVNIYDLGLIYDTKIDDKGTVDIEMSLTAPGCPVAGEMPGMVANAVTQVEGTGVVTVRLVWEPQWTMDRMSEDAKLALGMI